MIAIRGDAADGVDGVEEGGVLRTNRLRTTWGEGEVISGRSLSNAKYNI